MTTEARQRNVGRPPGPAVDPAVRRAELLEAAIRVIRRDGPAPSMDALAAEAGLTKPILYSHFGDRAGLAAAIAERIVSDLGQRLFLAFARGATETDPRRQFRIGLEPFVTFIDEDPHVYQFLVRESVNSAGSGNSIARTRVFDSLGRLITAGVTQQYRQAGHDESQAEPVAFAVMGMVFGATEWWLDRGGMSRDELIDLLTDFFWRGIGISGG
jgi:AcrR family transcriptional regulator